MILVSGGTGLLGSHLLSRLVLAEEDVVAIHRPSSGLDEVRKVFGYYGLGKNEFSRIRWVECEFSDYHELASCMEGAKKVYHCAARVSFQPREASSMIAFNTESTANMVNACLEHGARLLHVSSSSAIGKAGNLKPANEDLIWTGGKGTSSYAISKFRSEMEVWRGFEEGLDGIIVNPVIILGPGYWERGSSSIIRRVANGMKYGTPGITGYVGVQDVVSAMTELMNSELSGERYILSAAEYSYAELFEMVASALGQARRMKSVSPALLRTLAKLDGIKGLFSGRRSLTPEQAASAFNKSFYSNEKIIRALGFKFTPIPEVIEEVAGFYLREFPFSDS